MNTVHQAVIFPIIDTLYTETVDNYDNEANANPMNKDLLNANTWFVENEELLDLNNLFNHVSYTEITKDNATIYAKELNPALFKKKKKYLIFSIAFLVIGWIVTMLTSFPLVIIGIVLFIIFLNTNNRIKNIKKSIISLKTSERFILYHTEALSIKENEFGIKCGKNAIYTEDNAILSGENICLVYISETKVLFIPIRKNIVFGTTNGELINYGHKITEQKSEFILNFMANSNPNIMIGATTENLKRFKQIKKNRQ